MITTLIRPAIRPYSIAVAPDCLRQNSQLGRNHGGRSRLLIFSLAWQLLTIRELPMPTTEPHQTRISARRAVQKLLDEAEWVLQRTGRYTEFTTRGMRPKRLVSLPPNYRPILTLLRPGVSAIVGSIAASDAGRRRRYAADHPSALGRGTTRPSSFGATALVEEARDLKLKTAHGRVCGKLLRWTLEGRVANQSRGQ